VCRGWRAERPRDADVEGVRAVVWIRRCRCGRERRDGGGGVQRRLVEGLRGAVAQPQQRVETVAGRAREGHDEEPASEAGVGDPGGGGEGDGEAGRGSGLVM